MYNIKYKSKLKTNGSSLKILPSLIVHYKLINPFQRFLFKNLDYNELIV